MICFHAVPQPVGFGARFAPTTSPGRGAGGGTGIFGAVSGALVGCDANTVEDGTGVEREGVAAGSGFPLSFWPIFGRSLGSGVQNYTRG